MSEFKYISINGLLIYVNREKCVGAGGRGWEGARNIGLAGTEQVQEGRSGECNNWAVVECWALSAERNVTLRGNFSKL